MVFTLHEWNPSEPRGSSMTVDAPDEQMSLR